MPASRWSVAASQAWYASRPWLIGFNFVPSYACNTTEWWQSATYDPQSIARELRWAAAIGFNTTRVFIQYLVWRDAPEAFLTRFDQFLQIAAQQGLSVMPVLFDDCSFGLPRQFDPFLGRQREPIPGMLGPSWTPSPGRTLAADPTERPRLKRYVQDLLARFNADPRVLAWDLFNEPMNEAATGTPDFLETAWAWAREVGPAQPLTIGVWNDNPGVNAVALAQSDVISFHLYADGPAMRYRMQALQAHGRPVICTEWMARGMGSRIETDLPLFQQAGVGCYQWGLVNGRMQCQFPWSNGPGGEVDAKTGWFSDLLHPDGTPYRQTEVDAIRRASRGK